MFGAISEDLAVNVIRVTNDYEKFAFSKENRTVNQTQVRKLADKMARKDLGVDNPILVVPHDSKLVIIDGQHRYTVRTKLQLPIYYMIARDTKIIDVAMVTDTVCKWKMPDYVLRQVNLGNNDYIQLTDFVNRYQNMGMTLDTALNILGSHNRGGITTAKTHSGIKHGLLKFPTTNDHIIDTEHIIEMCEYLNTSSKTKIIDRTLTRAYMSHIKKTVGYDHSLMMSQLTKKKLYSYKNPKDLAIHLNEIYNYNKGKKSSLKFSGL